MRSFTVLAVLAAFVAAAQAGTWVYIEDDAPPMRFRRAAQEEVEPLLPLPLSSLVPQPLRRQGSAGPYQPADLPVAASSYGPKHKGRVGPVYTFVKTDPEANFKWGVRHVAGSQYGK